MERLPRRRAHRIRPTAWPEDGDIPAQRVRPARKAWRAVPVAGEYCRSQLSDASTSGAHRPGSSSGLVSNGNREANAGSRSDSQIAFGSNRAKNGLPTMDGLRAWIMCRANTFSPATSTTPSTHTLPGVADMDGPRTVRHRPETFA